MRDIGAIPLTVSRIEPWVSPAMHTKPPCEPRVRLDRDTAAAQITMI